MLFCPGAQEHQIPSSSVCCHSSALNTLQNIFHSTIIESPKDRHLHKHLDFLDEPVPCHQQENFWWTGLARSREEQKACQLPAEKHFNLVTYRPITGSQCLQVCIPDYYQSNYKYRRIYSKTILLFQSGLVPLLGQDEFQELCFNSIKKESSHLKSG